jgi:hypothetical protein
MNIDAKLLYKIFANQIQQYLKNLYIIIKLVSFREARMVEHTQSIIVIQHTN